MNAPLTTTQKASEVIPARLAALRAKMVERDVHAVLIPSADPHLSEYLPERWQARQWYSGFTGSMATLIVTRTAALVFADSRYWVQAEAELAGTTAELVKIATGTSTDHIAWLANNLKAGETLAVDGAVLALGMHALIEAALVPKGIRIATDVDAAGDAWANRAPMPSALVYEHRGPQAPHSRGQKLAGIRAGMREAGATHHFISTLDDIAWALNLRGADVSFNPVFLAHMLVDAASATLFIGEGKIDSALAQTLKADGVVLAPYDSAARALTAIPADAKMLVDPKRVTLAFVKSLPASVTIIQRINPSTLAKSRKSADEAVHIREAMARDGAAMCRFYAWFEQALGKEHIDELTIDEKLAAERTKEPGFVSLSFNTIAGFNANGAMPHYRATRESHAQISTPAGVVADGMLLIDSGGQYLGGTTDITRVWPVGRITAEHKRDYTLVLKGTIALSVTKFPVGTLSPMLDAIARAPLWAHGLDYGHGTGHGVGYFMNVHEGPQSIARVVPDANMAMQPGMVTSIEPGLYRPNQWGVRIENLVLNVASASSEFGNFLEFETLTLCPIDTRLIDASLLSVSEVEWLNRYHATVRERLSPLVSGDALTWLVKRTEAI
jgi:Xaa-Pro aminopeptidase